MSSAITLLVRRGRKLSTPVGHLALSTSVVMVDRPHTGAVATTVRTKLATMVGSERVVVEQGLQIPLGTQVVTEVTDTHSYDGSFFNLNTL